MFKICRHCCLRKLSVPAAPTQDIYDVVQLARHNSAPSVCATTSSGLLATTIVERTNMTRQVRARFMESGSFFFQLISQDWLLCLVIGYPAIRESRNADNRTYVDSFGTVPNLLIRRSIARWNGASLFRDSITPRLIIVGGICAQDPAQVRFTEYDDVIEALPADRANEPLNVSVLPG